MILLKNVGAVVLGMVVGNLLNFLLLQVNLQIFPLPEGVGLSDTEALGAAIRGMPWAAWILVFAAHLGQAFVGGWVAARCAASSPLLLALIVGALSMVGGILNALSLSLPSWSWIEMPLYLLAGYLGGRIEVQRRRRRGLH